MDGGRHLRVAEVEPRLLVVVVGLGVAGVDGGELGCVGTDAPRILSKSAAPPLDGRPTTVVVFINDERPPRAHASADTSPTYL